MKRLIAVLFFLLLFVLLDFSLSGEFLGVLRRKEIQNKPGVENPNPPGQQNKEGDKEKMCRPILYKGEHRRICYLGNVEVESGDVGLLNSTVKLPQNLKD